MAFAHAPPLAGAIEYLVPQRPTVTVGVMEGYVHNEGDAWKYTLDSVERYFESMLSRKPPPELPAGAAARADVEAGRGKAPGLADTMFGPYLESAALLGRRTAELHIALAADTDVPHFGREPFSHFYQRSVYQAIRTLGCAEPADLAAKTGDTFLRTSKPRARQ